jgi:O-antigen ligase
MALFAVFVSLLVFYRQKSILMMNRMNKSLGRVIVIIVTILGIGVGLMGAVETGYLKNNALERLLSDEQAERSTIEGRLEYIKLGAELFVSSPLIGVGTGSFRDYLTIRKDRHSIKRANLQIFDDARDPHQFFVTILSEGGVVAMGLYALFLIYAFRSDWKRRTVGSILFWTLFLYGMANPVATSIHFNLLLILFRFM